VPSAGIASRLDNRAPDTSPPLHRRALLVLLRLADAIGYLLSCWDREINLKENKLLIRDLDGLKMSHYLCSCLLAVIDNFL